MPDNTPPQRVLPTDLPDGVRLTLPPRNIPESARHVGGAVFVAGVVDLAVVIALGAGFVWRSAHTGNWMWLIPAVVIGPILALGGALAVFFGLLMQRGHSEVEIAGDAITSVERVGALRWRRTRAAATLKRFQITDALAKPSDRNPAGVGLTPAWSAITAIFDDQRPLIIAPGYPRDLLTTLAQEIARRCDLAAPDPLMGSHRAAVEITRGEPGAAAVQVSPPAERPPTSDIELTTNPDGLTLTVPPMGLRAGAKSLYSFALVWCVAVTIMFGLALLAAIGLVHTKGSPVPWWGPLLTLPFVAVGVALVGGALNMARRRAIIDIVGETLLLNEAGPLGLRSRQWESARLVAIRCGPSVMRVNDVPVPELQILAMDGDNRLLTTTGLFAGREEEELRWIASVLRAATGAPEAPGLPRTTPAGAPADNPVSKAA